MLCDRERTRLSDGRYLPDAISGKTSYCDLDSPRVTGRSSSYLERPLDIDVDVHQNPEYVISAILRTRQASNSVSPNVHTRAIIQDYAPLGRRTRSKLHVPNVTDHHQRDRFDHEYGRQSEIVGVAPPNGSGQMGQTRSL